MERVLEEMLEERSRSLEKLGRWLARSRRVKCGVRKEPAIKSLKIVVGMA